MQQNLTPSEEEKDEEIPHAYIQARGITEADFLQAKRHRIYFWLSNAVIGLTMSYLASFVKEKYHIKPIGWGITGLSLASLLLVVFPKAFKMHTAQYQTYARWYAIKKHLPKKD